MLPAKEKAILERSLATILRSPHSISQSLFSETYNTIYAHCTAPSEEYSIKGDLIYDLLAENIDTFASKLKFQGSVPTLAGQVGIFRSSLVLITKIFSYLERFYIRTSMLRSLQVQKLRDLFHSKIYYNYIYKVEENMLDLIFLEIETSRKLHRQEYDELKTVVTFYLELLVGTGQEGAMRHFFKRYVEDFRLHTNFNLEIGKLLKKIYLEVFFASGVLGDREVCKEIIREIVFRKDEIVEHVFAKIVSFEKFKHIYKIISMMPETVKNQFRCRYGEVLGLSFGGLSTFFEIYRMYAKMRKQIVMNKMSGYGEMLDSTVKKMFSEKKSADQMEIQAGMVDAIEKFIEKHDFDTGGNLGAGSDGLSKKFGRKDKECEHEFPVDLEIYFDLFALIFTEYLMDLYTERCQHRLLKGLSPIKEQVYEEMILERIGWSAATRLKSSVSSFTSRYVLEIPVEERKHSDSAPEHSNFKVSLAKITKGFWDVERNEVNLHLSLERAKCSVSGLVQLAERQKLDFNYRLSPVVFEINGTKYRISGDVFSMYLHVLTADGIGVEELRSLCSDRHFDANIDFLVRNEFVLYDGRFRTVEKRSDQKFVDLFVVPKKLAVKEEAAYASEKNIHVVESRICSIMKKSKRMLKQALAESVECDRLDFEMAFTGLISKGLLEVKETEAIYIP